MISVRMMTFTNNLNMLVQLRVLSLGPLTSHLYSFSLTFVHEDFWSVETPVKWVTTFNYRAGGGYIGLCVLR